MEKIVKYGYFGWQEICNRRKKLIDAYENEKKSNISHPVRASHGTVAEYELCKLFEGFLPKKFGVTSGYVIPDSISTKEYKLRHYDIIIYDRLNSPVLWESGLDQANHAIPARYIFMVIEVKSTLTVKSAQESLKKLGELNQFKSSFPVSFRSKVIFMELGDNFNYSGLKYLIPNTDIVGYSGGLIVKTSLNLEQSASFYFNKQKNTPCEVDLVRDLEKISYSKDSSDNWIINEQGSGLTAFSDGKRYHFYKTYGPIYCSGEKTLFLNWSYNEFIKFIWDLIDKPGEIAPILSFNQA